MLDTDVRFLATKKFAVTRCFYMIALNTMLFLLGSCNVSQLIIAMLMKRLFSVNSPMFF